MRVGWSSGSLEMPQGDRYNVPDYLSTMFLKVSSQAGKICSKVTTRKRLERFGEVGLVFMKRMALD